MFIHGDEITGVIDWSEAGQGDPLCDLASLTLGHEEHLGDVQASAKGSKPDADACHVRPVMCLRGPGAYIEHMPRSRLGPLSSCARLPGATSCTGSGSGRG
jgi:hypothetical protein